MMPSNFLPRSAFSIDFSFPSSNDLKRKQKCTSMLLRQMQRKNAQMGGGGKVFVKEERLTNTRIVQPLFLPFLA